MRVLFKPATNLMNRLSFQKRFTLLGLLFFVAVGVLAFSLFSSLNGVIAASRVQLSSVQLVRPMSRLIKAIQLHRGLSTAVLVGNTTLAKRLPAQRRECAAAWASLKEQLPADLALSADWADVTQDWNSLLISGHTLTADQNLAAHKHVMEDLRILRSVYSEAADVDVFFLFDVTTRTLPAVIEQFGRLRATGTAILTLGALADGEKNKVIGAIAQLNDALENLKLGLEKSAQYNPELAPTLAKVSRGLSFMAKQVIDQVQANIVSGRLSAWPEEFMDQLSAVIDQSYSHIYTSLLPAAEQRIQRRIAEAEGSLQLTLVVALALFLVVVYLAVGFYLATVTSVRSLSVSARAFAAGDLEARVALDTGDELQHVGDSFNEMARSFGALLAERHQAEELLRSTAREVEDLYDNAPCGYHSVDANGIIVKINKTELDWLGYNRDELVGKTQWCSLVDPSSSQACIAALERLVQDGVARDQELRVRKKDGTVIAGLLNATAVYDSTGRFLEGRSTVYDITDRQRHAERIYHMAHHDALTGLPNRLLLTDRLGQALKVAHRLNQRVALLFIDIDRFKEVNDALGHCAGDMLLKEAANRIASCIRDSDSVARLGGDEFTVILNGLEKISAVEAVGERILRRLREPIALASDTAHVSVSIGVTFYPDDGLNVDDLLKGADQAMYAAKNAGRDRMSYFTAAMQQACVKRQRLVADLRQAIGTDQLSLHFQPIIELASGRVCKGEALLRWRHPGEGMIGPADFIPLAEETGLIVEIGQWVFAETARQVLRWRSVCEPQLQVSVNVSAIQFRNNGSMFGEWIQSLTAMDLPGRAIAIEITESLLLDTACGVREKLQAFRHAGIQVAVDDFGTGYSSLAYLTKLDLDFMKIDRSFVQYLERDANDRALCEAMIMMAHKLGLRVVAEGVETQEQRQLLQSWGCDFAQGYLFSRPLPPEQFEMFLHDSQLAASELDHAGQGLGL